MNRLRWTISFALVAAAVGGCKQYGGSIPPDPTPKFPPNAKDQKPGEPVPPAPPPPPPPR